MRIREVLQLLGDYRVELTAARVLVYTKFKPKALKLKATKPNHGNANIRTQQGYPQASHARSPNNYNKPVSIGIARLLLLPLLPLLLSACELLLSSGGSSGSSSPRPTPQPVKPFSHASYSFAPHNVGAVAGMSAEDRIVGNIFANQNEVKRLVAGRLGVGNDEHKIFALATPHNFTLSYRLADDDLSSDTNTFLEIKASAQNPYHAIIRVQDPVEADLDTNEIIDLVPRFQVEMSISIPILDKEPIILKHLVRVNLQQRADDFDLNKLLLYNQRSITEKPASPLQNIKLRRTTEITENNRLAARVALSRRGNVMREYGLDYVKEFDVTLFWGLVDKEDSSQACSAGNFYIDNNDLQVKANNLLDFETDLIKHSCRLAISENGIDYTTLAFGVGADMNVTGEALFSDGRGGIGGATTFTGTSASIAEVVSADATNKSCFSDADMSCYYADLEISLVGVDEEPIINDIGIIKVAEGVGALAAYSTAEVVYGGPLSAGVMRYDVQIEDEDQDGHSAPLPVQSARIIGVDPRHGRDLFSISNVTSFTYQLEFNRSKLDYEIFTDAELSNGRAIYDITIEAVDGTEDGGGPKRHRSILQVEVTDVIYRPIFVATSSAAKPAAAIPPRTNPITLEANLEEGPDFSVSGAGQLSVSVLPATQPFIINRHRLGSFAAVDPESGNDEDILYSFVPTDVTNFRPSPRAVLRRARAQREFAENFALLPLTKNSNGVGGRRLIIANVGLSEDSDDIGLTLQLVNKKVIRNILDKVDNFLADDLADALSNGYGLTEEIVERQTANSNDADPRLNYFIDIEVIDRDTAPSDRFPALPHPDTLNFNKEFPLVGFMQEATAGASVIYPSFRVLEAVLERNSSIENLLGAIVIPSEAQSQGPGSDTPRYGFFPPQQLLRNPAVAADLASLELPYIQNPRPLFDINAATGRVSARTNNLLFPGPYILLVYLTSQANYDAAGSEAALLRRTSDFDVAALSIFMTDVNAPPVLNEFNDERGDNTITVRIREDAALPGVELVRFSIEDDNDKLPTGFSANLSSPISTSNPQLGNLSDLLSVSFETANQGKANEEVVGVVTLKTRLDYETQNQMLRSLRIIISDSGGYSFNNNTGVVERPTIPIDVKSSELLLNIDLRDAAEAPIVRPAANVTLAGIKETAGSDPNVNIFATAYDGNNLTDNVALLMVDNIGDFATDSNGDRRVTYAVVGELAGVLRVVPENLPGLVLGVGGVNTNEEPLALGLAVANADLLENIGDGRVFVAEVQVRDAISGLTGTAKLPVRIVNDPSTSTIGSIQDLLDGLDLVIREREVQGVVAARPFVRGFTLSEGDLIADADEFLSRSSVRTRFNLQFSIAEQLANNNAGGLTPQLPAANVIEIVPQEEVFRMRVVDTDFIEQSLFGDIEFVLNVTDTITGSSEVGRGRVRVIPETPKAVTYADSNGDVANIPVYALSYVQSDYAAQLGEPGNSQVIPTTDINSAIGFPRGVAANSVIKLSIGSIDEYYPTLRLQGIEVSSQANFIARSNRSLLKAENDNVLLQGKSVAEQQVILNFAESVALDEGVDILIEDGRGNLIDGSEQFNVYFDLEVVSDPGQEPYLSIKQREFAYAAGQNSAGSSGYSALDTLALFENAQTSAQLNYFIRAKAYSLNSDTDASRYALAQFSVALQATGINQPTYITNIALVPDGEGFSHNASIRFSTFSGQLARDLRENEFALGSFTVADAYDLLVEFYNPDAAQRMEVASLVNLSITEDDGSLISLRLNSTKAATDIGGAVEVLSMPDVNGNNSEFSHFTDADERYMVRYDFALAPNTNGEATINIQVQDRELGAVLSETSDDFIVRVAPKEAQDRLVLNITLGADNTALLDLIEDELPLNSDSTSTSIQFDYKVATASGRRLSEGVTETLSLLRVRNYPPQFAKEINNMTFTHNSLGKQFIHRLNETTMSYAANGWGLQSLDFELELDEPFGFKGRRLRSINITYDIYVDEVDDPTRVRFANFVNFDSDDFTNRQGDFIRQIARRVNEGAIVISDSDLEYDSVAATLGDQLSLESDPVVGGAAIEFEQQSYSLVQDPARPTFLSAAAFNYNLNMTEEQFNILRNNDGVSFNLTLSFPAKPIDNVVSDEGGNAKEIITPAINFVINSVDPKIQASDVFSQDEIGYVEVAEGAASDLMAQLIFTDADLVRLGSKLEGLSTSAGFFNFAPLEVTTAGRKVSDLLEWQAVVPRVVQNTNRATNEVLLQRTPQDADVGEYDVAWRFIDTFAFAGTNSFTGNFTLNITRVEDESEIKSFVLTNTLPNIGTIGSTQLNINNPSAHNFPINLTFTDDDFLEPNQAAPIEVSASYNNITFNLVDPSVDSPNLIIADPASSYECSIGNSQAASSSSSSSLSPLLSEARIAPFVYENMADIVGDLHTLSNNVARPLTLADLLNATNPACESPAIGTKINAATIRGLSIASPAAQVFDNVTINSVDYVLTGYRMNPPTARLIDRTVSIGRSGAVTTFIVITDNDPDDGVPTLTNPPLAVRGEFGGSPWASGPSHSVDKTDCSADINVALGDYQAAQAGITLADNQAVAQITIDAMDGSGTCIISISGEEDGQRFESNLSLVFEELPLVRITTSSVPPDFAYESFTVSGVVGDGDPDDGKFPVGGFIDDEGLLSREAFVSLSPDVCEVVANSNSSIQDYSAEVMPLSPGRCSLSFRAVEDLVVARATTEILLVDAEPSLEILSVRNEDAAPVTFELSADSFYAGVDLATSSANPAASFIVGLVATNVDPGDDDNRDVDVGFRQDFESGNCLIELVTENTNYTMAADGSSVATAFYRIIMKSSSTNPLGNCGSGNIKFNVDEDNADGLFSIEASKFEFVAIPFVGKHVELQAFANYTEDFRYQFSVIIGDTTGVGSVDVGATALDATICSVASPANIPPKNLNAPIKDRPYTDEYLYDLIITPLQPGNCMLNLTSMSPEYESHSVLSIVLTEAVPRVVMQEVSITDDFAFEPLTIVAEIFDSDPGDNKFPVGQGFVSHTTEVCSVGAATSSGTNDYRHSAEVTPVRPGECVVSFSAEEDEVIGMDNISFVFPELAPTLQIVAVSNGDSTPQNFAATADRFYTANGTSFVVELEATNMDPGDDSGRDIDVAFKQDFTFGRCRISLISSQTSANYTADATATAFYAVNLTATAGSEAGREVGSCDGGGTGDIVFGVTEDEVSANYSIAASKFDFEGVPSVAAGSIDSIYVPFSGYRENLGNLVVTPITYGVIVTDNDRDDTTNVTLSSVMGLTATTCEVAGLSALISFEPLQDSGISSALYNASLAITPVMPGECRVRVEATDDEYSATDEFSIQLPHLAPQIAVEIIGAVDGVRSVRQGEEIRIKVTATKTDPGTGEVLFPDVVTDGASCTANIDSATRTGGASTPANPYNQVGHQASVEYVVTSSSDSGDLCGELVFIVTDDGIPAQGEVAANRLQFTGASLNAYAPIGGTGTALQASGEIKAQSTGRVWFEVTNTIQGCDVYPQGQVEASAISEGATTKFIIKQNNLTLGQDDCSIPNKFRQDADANSNSGSIIITAYSGVLGDTSTMLEQEVTDFGDVVFNPPAVGLSLYNESPYYLLTDIIRGAETNSTPAAPLLEDQDRVNLYKHLQPRGWNFASGDEITSVVSTGGEGLEPRDLSFDGSWLGRYQTRTTVPYASDSFYVNLSGVLAEPTPALDRAYDAADLYKTGDVLLRDDLSFTPWSLRSLQNASYDEELFRDLANQYGVDAYLKFTSRQADLYADAVTTTARIHPTFATKDTLIGIITEGLSSIPQMSAGDKGKVKLQARVCHLVDIQPPVGINLDSLLGLPLPAASTRPLLFDHQAALAGLSINCYGDEADIFADADAKKITTLGGIWQQGEDTNLCDNVNGYGARGGNEVDRVNNESCTSLGSLNSPSYGNSSYYVAEDISEDNPLPWNLQQYVHYREFSNESRRSMHYPSIYLVEVYPLAAADLSQVLGAPLRLMFQVEPRERARLR